jgi:hypothetical protein
MVSGFSIVRVKTFGPSGVGNIIAPLTGMLSADDGVGVVDIEVIK